MSIDAMKQMIAALLKAEHAMQCDEAQDQITLAIAAGRAAIEAAEKQEPVACLKRDCIEFRKGMNDELFKQSLTDRGLDVFTTPQPAIPDGWQLVPTKDTDAAKEIVSLAFNEAMSIQAGELGPITLRQKNAIHAIVWDVIDAMLAAAPKPGEKE